ncbi:MlaE family lipid ABC transporter permease subunit [Pararhodobacter sp. SW119]|uniref:ABC transporter permease n=1 Tax=Pararhodobacter sp. SW119 TaxID=2780075 RepID=UPI001AE0C7D1|nr:MlaE family lipid ABC transporter permease subunit [Pararhodobacter sp. SW119]
MTEHQVQIEEGDEDGTRVLRLSGDLSVQTLGKVEPVLARHDAGVPLKLDLSDVDRFDTAGAWAIAQLQVRMEAAGSALELSGADSRQRQLLETVTAALPQPPEETPRRRGLLEMLDALGRATVSAGLFLAELSHVLGLFLGRLARSLLQPRRLRWTALVAHCQDVGWRAIPIVSLMAFLIGVVLAFQGSVQLRQFGVEVFVVDLIAISILRELGILLTAIIVAGRTASAFTAAIGSMKMREEIDAMQTLGIDPAEALFLPRILALLLMLPILGLIANLMGLFGGLVMSWIELGISPAMFITRLVEGTSIDHVIVGMVKAPVFAIIIGVVGVHGGMKVESNAESLGRMTSASVVTAIFAVIVADAMFSIFFARLGM